MSMKILFIVPSVDSNGPTNVVLSLIEKLSDLDVELYFAYFWGDDIKNIKFIKSNCKDVLNLKKFSIKSIYKLNLFLRKIKIDIIHSHCLLPDVVTPLATLFSPTKKITTVHCNLLEDYTKEYPKFKAKIYFKIHTFFLNFYDRVTTVSDSASSCLESIKTTTVYNGVEISPIVTKQESIEVNLVFIGRLIQRKNVGFLINALEYINQKATSKLKLYIFGNGPDLERLKNISGPEIILSGFIEEPIQNIPTNSIVINPSLSEGMPMAILESISAGFPVLLSNIESHKEIKKKISTGVELFDFTQLSIEKALSKVTKDFKTISVNQKDMLNQFERSFTSKVMVNKYVELYKSTILKSTN